MGTQRGIALIQVLLISTIIGVLMLQLGLTARSQVQRAQALQDRMEVDLKARSVEAAITYTLLTEPLVAKPESGNPYASRWNFHGDWFEVEGVELRIQDQSGLYPTPLYGVGEFAQVFEGLGVAPARAARLAEEFAEFQGIGRGATDGLPEATAFPLQRLEDLKRLPAMDAGLFARVRPLLTLYPTPGFNPLTAPDELLAPRLSASERTALAELRNRNALDAQSLYDVTGLQADENLVMAPGPALDVEIRINGETAMARRRVVMLVRPYQNEAVAIWQRLEGSNS
jgi:general secretion pathway protein K